MPKRRRKREGGDEETLDVVGPCRELDAPGRETPGRPGIAFVGILRRALLEFLVADRPLGLGREGDRTLTLWWTGSSWKVCLRAKDASCVAFLTACDLSELFRDLNNRIEKEDLPWKEDRHPHGKGG